MEASTQHSTIEGAIPTEHDIQGSHSPTAILFTSFGIGKSYIFHVDKSVRLLMKDEVHSGDEENKYDPVRECWEEIFIKQKKDWEFEKLKHYYKPLGETATLTFCVKPYDKAIGPVNELREACDGELLATLEKVEAVFFTTGVAVLIFRIKPKEPGDILEYRLKDETKPLCTESA